MNYAEVQPILAIESNVSAHITSPGQGLKRGITLFISIAKLRHVSTFAVRHCDLWQATETNFPRNVIFLLSTDNKRVFACLYGRFFVIL